MRQERTVQGTVFDIFAERVDGCIVFGVGAACFVRGDDGMSRFF